jgi:hypothetical protein
MKTKFQRSVILALALALILVVPVLAAYPVSTQGVVPVFFDTGPGGNVTCEEVGDYEYASDRYDDGAQYGGTFMTINWTTTDNTYVSWSGEHGGMAVIVKGGNAAHVYVYGLDPYFNWDAELASPPVGQNQNVPGLSNITFCYNPPAEDEGQWCSPGYWRQSHHLDSWAATGISPDELYSAYFAPVSLSKKALSEGANANPTLWEVLQSPQWYGGEAFNNVGDLLSEAHPDVDFNGERIGDSCPLN